MEATLLGVKVVSQRAGAKANEVELLEAGPDSLLLRFTPNDPSPHHILLRLDSAHALGRRLALAPHQAPAQPPTRDEDPFTDSDDEFTTPTAAEAGQGDVGAMAAVAGNKAVGEKEELPKASEELDDVTALQRGLPLDFMPVSFRIAKKEVAEVEVLGGMGRGRAALGKPQSHPAAQQPSNGVAGGFSACKARAAGDWDKETGKEAGQKPANPQSSSLRAGLSGFSPPQTSAKDDSVKAAEAKMGELKLGGGPGVPLASKPLFPRNPPSSRPNLDSRPNQPVLEPFKPPVEEAWDIDDEPAKKPTAPLPSAQSKPSGQKLTMQLGFHSKPSQPAGAVTAGASKPFGSAEAESKKLGSFWTPAARPFGHSAAAAGKGSGAAGAEAKSAAPSSLGPEVRASWLAAKRSVREALSGEKPVLWGETLLQLGEVGKSEDREKHFNQPTAVAVNERNGDIIVADSQNRMVKIYKCSGSLKALIGNEDPRSRLPFHDPSGVVVISGETAAEDKVAVKCENGIHIIAYDGPAEDPQILLTIEANGPHPWLRHPMGLALTAQRHLLTISNAKSANVSTEVVVMEPETGSLVRRFPFRPAATVSGCQPRFLDVWQDRLVVSDLGKNLVYVLSVADGTELFRFGGPGRQPGKFTFASGVAVDGAGNMLVGDAKGNRVQLFGPDGHFLQVVQFSRSPEAGPKQLACPFPAGLHLTANSHLAFTSRGPQGQIVQVAQLVGKAQ